jgi:hypothetical protein
MSLVLNDLKNTLADWCQSYVSAFEAYDAAGISAHWTFPALTTAAGRSFTFKTEAHFTQNTAQLLEFYRRHAVARVQRDVIAHHPLHRDATAMTVADIMYTASGEEIARWHAAYVLQRVNGSWKAVMAVADGEMEAWAARGTPLGGS